MSFLETPSSPRDVPGSLQTKKYYIPYEVRPASTNNRPWIRAHGTQVFAQLEVLKFSIGATVSTRTWQTKLFKSKQRGRLNGCSRRTGRLKKCSGVSLRQSFRNRSSWNRSSTLANSFSISTSCKVERMSSDRFSALTGALSCFILDWPLLLNRTGSSSGWVKSTCETRALGWRWLTKVEG
uniref:Uncharacterized protein n=1 Tax=Schistocephalus solidus TaxID=70667 RepID=A0A0X3PKV5_SCHSO